MTPLFHLLFLAVLALCGVGLLLWPGHGRRAWGLGLIFGVAFLGLLVHQVWWQLHGAGSLEFQKFQRRYDVRPGTLARAADARGRLLDRNGRVLAQGLPSRRWGHDAPLGPAGLHVVGYSSREFGLSGLERVFDARLCGFALPETPQALLRRSTPEDVHTTLDARLQTAAFNALNGRKGAVVALDPRTGEILALVSSPSCTEEALSEAMRNTSEAPLFNRATQGLYPPGSVFKPFVAALALECRKAGRYACPAKGWSPALYTKPIRDTHPPEGDPLLPLRKAFALSSNIWFAKAATACGWTAFRDAAERCGLDKGFTLARCGERAYTAVAGSLPDLSESPNRVAYLGFGQGDLLLTPLHVAALTASFANGGRLIAPHLEKGVTGKEKRLWHRETAARVRALMRASVTEGTSRAAALPGLAVCGKTGTAETSGHDHAWFTCFAPEENPRIVITVLVEHGGFGAATALPVAKEVLKAWRALYL